MPNKIQFKRGAGAPGTTLDVGEPGYSTDGRVFYVGNGAGNAPTAFDLSNILSSIELEETGDGSLHIVKADGSTDNVDLLNGVVGEGETLGVTGEVINKAINTRISASAEVYVGTSTPETTYKIWLEPSGSSTTIYVNDSGSWIEVAAISGVFVGSGTMPSGYNVQVDPTGTAIEVATKAELDALAARVTALGG